MLPGARPRLDRKRRLRRLELAGSTGDYNFEGTWPGGASRTSGREPRSTNAASATAASIGGMGRRPGP